MRHCCHFPRTLGDEVCMIWLLMRFQWNCLVDSTFLWPINFLQSPEAATKRQAKADFQLSRSLPPRLVLRAYMVTESRESGGLATT